MKLKEIAALVRSGMARDVDLEGLKREDLIAIKKDCDSGLHYRFAPGLVSGSSSVHQKKLSASEREVVHDASDETVDSQGDVISVNGALGGKGWVLDRFRKNAQLLWNHKSSEKPIGLVKSARRGRGQEGQKALVTKSVFHERELFGDDPWGAHVEAVNRLVRNGALPGASVGFLPVKMHFPESEAERKELGLGRYGAYITESELAELSIVPVPSNKNAVQHRGIRDQVLKTMVEEGWGDEAWCESFVEEFPLDLDELRGTTRAIQRRSIQVPDLSGIYGALLEDQSADTSQETESKDETEAHHQAATGVSTDGLWPNQPFWNLGTGTTPVIWPPQPPVVDTKEFVDLLEKQTEVLNGVATAFESLTDAIDDIREVLSRVSKAINAAEDAPTRNGSPDDFMHEVLEGAIEAVKSRHN